ncbi:WbqC family protein [Flavobacterium sp.]|uniref:WbqC family protein n=1 Tax=Flavobacterium sp. TaxID=239 RepID=UPI00286B0243|nr:WbqC family protein [Flavobacterium sp.]
MKVAIMQPYWFPYIGYFQLIHAVDTFVIYDNIEYTKKGWINRNRILVNGEAAFLSVPLKKDSDFLNVDQRYLSETYSKDKMKLLSKIKESYQKAPQFQTVFPLVESILNRNEGNLFDFIHHSIQVICGYLDIKTNIVVSSTISIDHNLKAQDKVIAIAKNLSATQYINAIGGVELYSKETFEAHNLQLHFIKSNVIEYQQFDNDFIPWLSVIDVMMFNSKEKIQELLSNVTFQ